ncbi:MAG: aminodeoxychorismate synthase component I [Cyclobacteriaceae bacterium]
MTLNKTEAIQQINSLVRRQEPFLFITNFKCDRNIVLPLNQVNSEEILYDINGVSNVIEIPTIERDFSMSKSPISYEEFKETFSFVHDELHIGNSYLTNLTFETSIACNHSLKEIFYRSKAKYKLWLKDQFVVFSPEIFIQVQANEITSFPMKGTIDASFENAETSILENTKEMAEHVSIVDLIRNDMSIHATNVEVDRFRYIDEVQTHEKKLLQVSSEIRGKLSGEKLENLGEVLFSLLPAGSISGAPKYKTLEIIEKAEDYDRGYYTGVFGIFNGKQLDSGVMIRFIEQQEDQMVFKSGGGIHSLSDPKSEYEEMIDKVYVPIY